MSYNDDFYIEDNLVGFTGELHGYASFYFADQPVQNQYAHGGISFEGAGTHYGHITTSHQKSNNVGRGRVVLSKGYSIQNIMAKGALASHEIDPVRRSRSNTNGIAGCFHCSRNLFRPLSSLPLTGQAHAYRRARRAIEIYHFAKWKYAPNGTPDPQGGFITKMLNGRLEYHSPEY